MRETAIGGSAAATAAPRLLQELGETLQRLRLGGPFYVLLWLLAGAASGLWQSARWPFLLVALAFVVLVVVRFRIHGVPAGASEAAVRRRLDQIWALLLANAAVWGAASAWLLMVTPNESARTVAAISSYAFATAFAHNFPMRLRHAYLAVALTYLPTLGAFIANGSRFELVAVSFLYLLYVSLALRRSHVEYRQRLDLEDELREQRDLFEQQSRRDGLTGLANRRRFSAALVDWVAAARGNGAQMALLILDLDHFKLVNDRHGHAAGDACLRSFAEQLQRAFPAPGELVARLGGEEFGVLLRGCALDDAVRRADAFRQACAEHVLAWDDGDVRITVSIGVAALDHERDPDGGRLFQAADSALYRAKAAGRNAVQVATPA
ncbi:MAG TPA: GGDEF domain-containing protein [Thermomonas sp.]|nr:GGDEF domain-containing protein [Thermomonas sp.]